jgi:hypothetical protein
MHKTKLIILTQDNIDAEIRDKKGRLAIDLAKSRGHTYIVDYLKRYKQIRKNKYCTAK